MDLRKGENEKQDQKRFNAVGKQDVDVIIQD